MEIQAIGAAAEEEPRAARISCWEWEYQLQPTGDIDVSDLLLHTLTYVMPRAPNLIHASGTCQAWRERVEYLPQWGSMPMPGSGPVENDIELFDSSSEGGHDNAAPVCASRSEYIKKVTEAKAIEDLLRQHARWRRARYLLRNFFYSFGLWAYFAFMMCCAFAIAWGIGRGGQCRPRRRGCRRHCLLHRSPF